MVDVHRVMGTWSVVTWLCAVKLGSHGPGGQAYGIRY